MKLLLKFNKLVIPPVEIVLENFRNCKRSDDIWYSPPFYSRVGGYKLCLGVYANGFAAEKGKHVSVFVYLMRGEFDDDLKWPFFGTITMHLENTRSYKPQCSRRILPLNVAVDGKPTEEKNIVGRAYDFISHRDLGSYSDELVFCISDINEFGTM